MARFQWKFLFFAPPTLSGLAYILFLRKMSIRTLISCPVTLSPHPARRQSHQMMMIRRHCCHRPSQTRFHHYYCCCCCFHDRRHFRHSLVASFLRHHRDRPDSLGPRARFLHHRYCCSHRHAPPEIEVSVRVGQRSVESWLVETAAQVRTIPRLCLFPVSSFLFGAVETRSCVRIQGRKKKHTSALSSNIGMHNSKIAHDLG